MEQHGRFTQLGASGEATGPGEGGGGNAWDQALEHANRCYEAGFITQPNTSVTGSFSGAPLPPLDLRSDPHRNRVALSFNESPGHYAHPRLVQDSQDPWLSELNEQPGGSEPNPKDLSDTSLQTSNSLANTAQGTSSIRPPENKQVFFSITCISCWREGSACVWDGTTRHQYGDRSQAADPSDQCDSCKRTRSACEASCEF